MKYKVLWIDDDCNTTGRDFIGQAEQDDVDITAFESHEEGIAFLEKNLNSFHAVILDAKVKHKKDDTVIGLDGLRASRDRLIELNNKVDLPYFIFTGQPDYQTNEVFKESYGDFYIKGEDNEKLIEELIKRIDNKEDYILQNEYRRVFEVCSEKYIGTESKKHLIKILASIRKPNEVFDDELYFTQIRIILELMFRAANKLGLLHNACILNGKVNLSESSLFLAGKETLHLNVRCCISHFPKLIADSVQSILFITGAASHTTDPGIKNNIDLLAYRKIVQTPYLLYGLTFRLMDVLIWFKEYVDLNPNIEDNKKSWINTESIIHNSDWIFGSIITIAENGYGTFKPDSDSRTISIIPKMISDYSFKENDKVKVTTKKDNTGTKTYINLIEKI
ncbi:MAG: hypothetical protein EXR20_09790 [Bacteroidetes bacterium]|nr:hypothetical protein [Bacteroidota bacterium]